MQTSTGKARRLAFRLLAILWACWFAVFEWALYSESGSILPSGPVDAHDEYDLLFWTALMVWTYLTPLGLLVIIIARRTLDVPDMLEP
jgi:hypothetical protein